VVDEGGSGSRLGQLRGRGGERRMYPTHQAKGGRLGSLVKGAKRSGNKRKETEAKGPTTSRKQGKSIRVSASMTSQEKRNRLRGEGKTGRKTLLFLSGGTEK